MDNKEGDPIEDSDQLNVRYLEILGAERDDGDEFDLDTHVASAVLEYLEQKNVEGVENLAVLRFSKEDGEDREKVYEDKIMLVTVDRVEEEEYYGVWMKV
jgi:hypothetical protein